MVHDMKNFLKYTKPKFLKPLQITRNFYTPLKKVKLISSIFTILSEKRDFVIFKLINFCSKYFIKSKGVASGAKGAISPH